MSVKQIIKGAVCVILIICIFLIGQKVMQHIMISKATIEVETKNQREEGTKNMKTQLTYLGQASIKIVTPENKVIYIDPYAGEDYEMPADLILVTHEHFDHNDISRVQNRSSDCHIITEREAISNGIHQIFQFDFVTVQPVEAGYNRMHSVKNCVGYVLTMSDGVKVYVTGDTSKTKQMEEMSEMNIDYAFYCQDGVYNMGMKEAAECAKLVGAKYNIPYHNDTSNSGEMFDRKKAEKFDVENLLIIQPGETIELHKF